FKPTQNYDNAYRVTARFLVWIETKVKKGTVKKLDSQMRNHTYTAESWNKLTGKSVDDLWKDYAANPAL
ncbi:basic secretory protein-like protein, partial [Mucilaginibacter sp. 5B2]|nr:basic secretory protein-like protein [Mucilaginibacter sp. 5B2]